MPRRVPVPSLRPALDRCKPTGVVLGKGARVVVAADEGGVAAALAAVLEKRGVAVLSLDGALATDEVTSRLGRLAEGRSRPGRLLAARARRRAGHRRHGPRRLPRGEPPARQEPPRGHARAVRRRGRPRHVPRGGDPHGRPARPDAGGCDRSSRRGRGRLREVLQARAGRGPGEGRGLRPRRARGRGGRRAGRRGPGRPGRRRGRPSRRAPLDDHPRGAARGRRTSRAVADEGQRLRGHRSGGRHHERDRGRPGRRQRRHLLPARPRGRARARGREDRPAAAGPGEAEARPHRGVEGEGRASDPGGDRPADHGRRALRRGPAGDRVGRGGGRKGALALRQPARRAGDRRHRRGDPKGARPDRRPRARRRDRDQPEAVREGGQGVRPRLRHQGRRLLQPAEGGRGDAHRGDGRLQLGGRPVRQRGPDRLQRGEQPALRDVERAAAGPPRDPHDRDRLDGLGRHRHGHPRIDPPDHGGGRHLHAPARVRDPDRPPGARGGRRLGRAGRGRDARHHGRGVRPDRRAWTSRRRRPSSPAGSGPC